MVVQRCCQFSTKGNMIPQQEFFWEEVNFRIVVLTVVFATMEDTCLRRVENMDALTPDLITSARNTVIENGHGGCQRCHRAFGSKANYLISARTVRGQIAASMILADGQLISVTAPAAPLYAQPWARTVLDPALQRFHKSGAPPHIPCVPPPSGPGRDQDSPGC
jgi:hypothetical protein